MAKTSPIKVKRPVRKIVTKTPVEAKPVATAKATPRTAASRASHDIQSSYAGPSPVLSTRKSRTAIRTDEFGAAPSLVMSERDMALLGPLKRTYGNKPFPRADADVGIINRAIRKGMLKHVSGDATHETAQLRFV